ncbi:MAG: DNA repair protein RecN [Desulfobacteraceae bacterium]
MLKELFIKNFAIIDDIRISFSNGLSVLTGETGAGKSIIIEAVNLLLGGRAAAGLVRTGEDSAELEALFDIPQDSEAAALMKEQEMDPNEGLMIRRIISSEGRHRVFINARLSTMQLLKQITKNLAGVSSQHAHQGLLKEDTHLYILDRFAKTLELRDQVSKLFHQLVPLEKEISALKKGIEKTKEENEFLHFQIQEIETAAISPEEDKTLELEKKRLKNGAEIFDVLNRSELEIYSGENSLVERLGAIKADFEKYGEIDPVLAEKGEKLSHSLFELEDLSQELRDHAAGIELDPQALEDTEARLDLIQKLKRKYGPTLEDLFENYKNLKDRLAATEHIEDTISGLELKRDALLKELVEKSTVLSDKRKKSGTVLGRLAEKELADLEMDQTRFEVSIHSDQADPEKNEITAPNGDKITENGMDRVAFLMAPNPGEALKPLNRIASGGELSRVVLALKAVLYDTESLGTLIFDEVDAGIGGRTSEKVGKKLETLADQYQVICITHLAQIAKYGSRHFKISKAVVNDRTVTSILPLDLQEDRVKEIARMIGGEEITPATLAHAREMIC